MSSKKVNKRYEGVLEMVTNNKGWEMESKTVALIIDGTIPVNEKIVEVWRDGRKKHADILVKIERKKKDGTVYHVTLRIEVKTLHVTPATMTSNDEYNCGNGFYLCKGKTIYEQVKNYFRKADYYVTFVINEITDENSVLYMGRKAALDYFMPRISYCEIKGKPKCRFAHGGAMKQDNVNKRVHHFVEMGYTIK